MHSPSAATPPTAPPVRKRRWWLRGTLAAAALTIVALLGFFTYSTFSTRGDWADAEEEADRDDPRWRLLDLEADRPQVADADNSALYIIAVIAKGRIPIGAGPNYSVIFENLPANVQLNAQQAERIRAEFAKFPGQVEAARNLKDMPTGRFPITFSDDWIATLIPHQQETRQIAEWLKHDAWLLAQEGDCDAAIESCQAIINTSRSMKDEPFLISCLIRLAELTIALDALERVLAQGEASEEHLSAMQAMLEREMRQQDGFVRGMQGERAGTHHLFDNLRTGKLKTNPFTMFGNGPGVLTGDVFDDWLIQTFPSTLLKHYPEHLRRMNRMVAAAKLPLHERAAKLDEIHQEALRTKNPVSRLLLPATQKVEQAERRLHAYLRSMVVAVACERYRLKDEHKRWPATLDDLVTAKLLAAVPSDPIDNQPLRYRRTKEGIVVYSIGFDGKDNQGNINRARWHEPGVDLGYQLWDPQLRRRLPLPPVALPAGN